jgi:hypothetical protein
MKYLHKFTEMSRYGSYEVDIDEMKQDSFLRGLDPELRTLIGAGVYPDFNTTVNKAITTAKNKKTRRKTGRESLKQRRRTHRRRH